MIPLFRPYMAPEVGDAVRETLYSGYLTQGPQVEMFEAELAAYWDVDSVLTVNSGTSAIQLAAHLCDVRGRFVISTPMTCTATNTALLQMGAKILWADVKMDGNIDEMSIWELLLLHDNVAAIVTVDWTGNPCQYKRLGTLAHSFGVKLIRDAAHAFGATYDGWQVSPWPDFTCYSFQAIKHLTTGDGGALVCKSRADHARGKLLRWFGLDRNIGRTEQDLIEPGWKYHMNDISATIGRANLRHMPAVVEAHQTNGLFFDERFTQRSNVDTRSSHWVYPLLVEDPDRFVVAMKVAGIEASRVHRRNDRMPAFSASARHLPGMDAFTSQQVNIPCGWWLTEAQRKYIAEVVEEYV